MNAFLDEQKRLEQAEYNRIKEVNPPLHGANPKVLLQEKLLDQPEISEAVARLGGVRLGGSRASSE